MARKRFSNLALAPRNAASGSMPSLRAQLTTANSRSPISSLRSASLAAASTSASSSSILARAPLGSGQSKPVRAARFWSFSARSEGGEADRDPVERALCPLAPPLFGLDLFPQMMAALGCAAEDVRVAALHLVADRRR